MELNITKELITPLLSRKRVTLEFDAVKATPSRQDIIKAVADATKAKKELVIVKHIYTKFGSKRTKIIAHIYNDAAAMTKIEGAYLLKKHAEPVKKEEATA